MEKVYVTNVIEYNNPVLLRVWKKKSKECICSRLDSFQSFSIPFLGKNKHKNIANSIKILRLANNQELKLLNW